MRKKFIISVGVFVLYLSGTCLCQQKVFFENLTEKNGLSDNHVTCFLKDSIGYIWIGTESGLNRYDGHRFKTYSSAATAKQILSNNFITDIKQDNRGDLWVSTRKGLNRIDVSADTTEIIRAAGNNKNIDLPGESLWDVFPDSDTSVWVAIDAKPLIRLNPKTKKYYEYNFREFLKLNNIEFTPYYHSVFKILAKSANECWLATTDGIFSFSKSTGQFKLEAGVALDEISFFHFDTATQKLYCADERKILYIYEVLSQKLVQVKIDATSHAGKALPPYSLTGDLLFIPAPEGIAIVNQQNEVLSFLKGNDQSENNLLAGKINSAYKDRDSIVWIGTKKGISKFVPRLNANLHISFPENLVFDPVFALKNVFFHAQKNEWFVASYRDNIIWRVSNNSGLKTVLQKPAAYKKDICYAFYSHHPDTLFLLSDGSILTYYTKQNRWERIVLPSPWKKGSLTCMAIDEAGNYWLGSRRSGVFVYLIKEKKIWAPTQEAFNIKIIHGLAYDKNNQCLWIAAFGGGVYKFDFTSNSFEFLKRVDNNPSALHSSLINDIVLDKQNNLWAATIEGGLAKYDMAKTKGFINFDLSSGLPDNNVYSVAQDAGDNIWFATIKGIGVIDKNTGKLKTLYNSESGLPYSKFQQTIYCLPDGKIATLVDNKLLCFDPELLRQGNNFPVLINEVRINDSGYTIRNDQIFRHRQNTIQFEFAALDFAAPEALEYFYRLEGLEKDWISNGKSHIVRYTALPAGNYVFTVNAKKTNGELYQHSARWAFRIQPAFWQTWWFQLLSALAIASVITVLVRRRINYIKNKAAVKQHLTELEVKVLRAQMNPHFIFNAMNSIQQFTLKNDIDNANRYISKFSTLLRRVLQSSQQPTITLDEEIEQLSLYLDIEKIRMGTDFGYEIIIDEEIETDALRIPGMLVQPFVENALKHGLSLKEGEKKLRIEFALTPDHYLSVIVTDNGIGRTKAAIINKQQQKLLPYESKGIKLVEERVQIFSKNNSVKKSLITTDLYSATGEAMGTRVVVTIPLPGQ